MKINVTMPDNSVRNQFLTQDVIAKLNTLGDVHFNERKTHYNDIEYANILNESDVIFTGWGCPCISENLEGLIKLPKLMIHMGGTVSPYIHKSMFDRGIKVCSANELFAVSVAEGTLAYMLSSLREIPRWNTVVQNGGWRNDVYNTRSLINKKVGLVGFGSVTRQLIKLLSVFNVEIYLYSKHMSTIDCEKIGCKKSSLTEIFEQCNVISLHSALTSETKGMITANLLQSIQDNAVLINTARYEIIEHESLCNELHKQRFTCVLDVFNEEPLSQSSPLRGLENVILIPHLAGPTSDLYSKIGFEMVMELDRFKNSKPLIYEINANNIKFMTAKG